MRTVTRTEIRVETRQVLVINRCGSLVQSWCAQCGEQAGMIRLEEAALAGVSLQAICRRLQGDSLHLVEIADGLNFICLNSLMK